MTTKCIICDIESTISDSRHREKFLPAKELTGEAATQAWHNYYRMLQFDPPYLRIINLLSELTLPIIIMTGVPEEFRIMVRKWLRTNGMRYNKLFMRPTEDITSSNAELKLTMLQRLRRADMQPIMAVDDMPETLAMFAANKVDICMLATNGNLSRYEG